MERFIIGIDPGLGGAIAFYPPMIDGFQAPVILHDMPLDAEGKLDPTALAGIIVDLLDEVPCDELGHDYRVHAVIENVCSRPRQAGAFAFGLSTGTIHGVLGAIGIPFSLVSPSAWKVKMGLKRHEGETVEQNKTRARAVAAQLFPYAASQFKRHRDDGRAEALLLAVYFAHNHK